MNTDPRRPPAGWVAHRTVHVHGGVRVVNGFDHVASIRPHALNGKLAQFELAAYHHLFHTIQDLLKWPIIGVDFVSHVLEADGLVPPDWRPFAAPVASPWIVEETTQAWRNISHSAHNEREGRLWDLASRVAYQLRLCSWRLRQLSEAYSDCLVAKVRGGEFVPGSRFDNGHVQLGYFSVQALLVDACVLRDALAEFTAHYVLNSSSFAPGVQVTTMSSLRDRVLRKLQSPEPLAVELLLASDEGGWLHNLGSYRDLIIHAAPIAKAEKQLLAITRTLPIAGLPGVPGIKLPLPADPGAIRARRSKGALFEDFNDQVHRFIGSIESTDSSLDSLEYAHAIVNRLSTWAKALVSRSRIRPMVPHIKASDIIGDVKITRM